MTLSPDRLGALGEREAARWLRRHGYKILARNWRYRHGELDLVARERRILVFVEVKTRRTTSPYPPELAVNTRKARCIHRTARAYIRRHPFRHWHSFRFDVVAVTVDPGDRVVQMRHLQDAF